jgi:hypothetical protein
VRYQGPHFESNVRHCGRESSVQLILADAVDEEADMSRAFIEIRLSHRGSSVCERHPYSAKGFYVR